VTLFRHEIRSCKEDTSLQVNEFDSRFQSM